MRIGELFGRREPVFSFEFFPPKTRSRRAGAAAHHRPACAICAPSFVSVTYGAGGSTREKTIDIVTRVKREYGIEAMAHLTCVGHDRDEIAAILDRLQACGIDNVLPLRGDPPQGETTLRTPGQRVRLRQPSWCASSASAATASAWRAPAIRKGTRNAATCALDIEHLRAEGRRRGRLRHHPALLRQRRLLRLRRRAPAALGITVPMVPGIMPITNVAQIERIARLCGARIPEPLREQLHAGRGR